MSKRKRILYVYHVASIGGGSYCLLNILKELDKEDYEPVVLLRRKGPLATEIEEMGIRVLFMPDMRTVPYNSSLFTPSKISNLFHIVISFCKFRRILHKESPQIVHINSMMLYPYLRVAKKCKMGTIIHIREHWEEGSHSFQRRIAISSIARNADEIVAINQYSASMLEQAGRDVSVVYDWIDMSKRYSPMPLSSIFNEDCSRLKVFMFMGGLQEIKGSLEVLSSFKELSNPNYRLLVLGIDPSTKPRGIRASIKSILARFGYPSYSEKVYSLIHSDPRIKCIPSTYYVKDLYDQVYCVLSYFTIPHANLALAECVIEGTVCIAASTPESLEYSMGGKLAILYKENDYEDFVSMFDTLEETYPFIKKQLHEDAKSIKELFDTEANSIRLQNVYSRICK